MAFFPLLFSLTLISFSSQLASAQNSTTLFPSNSSLHWTNADSSNIRTYRFSNGLLVRPVLLANATAEIYGNSFAFTFAFAFYCNRKITDKCTLRILLLKSAKGAIHTKYLPQGVWVANRDQPVSENAVLRAEPGKGLTLTNSDGHVAWSTNMSGDPISGMTLKDDGNLVLFSISKLDRDRDRYSSFENPANTLVIGQKLRGRHKLRSGKSNTNSKTGKISLSITSPSLTAFVKYKKSKPVAYLTLLPSQPVKKTAELKYVEFGNNTIKFLYEQENTRFYRYRDLKTVSPTRILRLDSDGALRVYFWDEGAGWGKGAGWGYEDVWDDDLCQLPLCCGKYGVCMKGGCGCPTATDGFPYFRPDPTAANHGCKFEYGDDLNPTTYTERLVDFGNYSNSIYFDPTAADARLTELGTCKQECAGNSNCSAAFFRYGGNTSEGLCYLLSEVLTIREKMIPGPMNLSAAFIKVRVPASPPPSPSQTPQRSPPQFPCLAPPARDRKGESSRSSSRSKIGKTLAAVIILGLCVIISWIIWWKIKRRCTVPDDYGKVLGAPMKFSSKDLCLATSKFSMRLGGGGFGTVFKGELKDGTPIAVKKLHCIEYGMCEFLSEMKTMGSIHHFNLVKLRGFCADESNRMLVYEFMSNSSLDKWIFTEGGKQALGWEIRRRIILNVARGLAYLHEECSKRIVHLDMKPHNILLDENYNAKISDFGLARFIDRNQSHVVTGMRGTLGYLAPEWQHSRITVKVDVYSFGVIVLEVLSGRMNLDYSQQDSDVNLLAVLQRKAREDRLMDIVDKNIVDLDSECHEEDILKMIKIGAWCLNEDPSKRPSMSIVVKILEGAMEIEHNIDFKFAHVLVVACKSSTEISSKLSLSES